MTAPSPIQVYIHVQAFQNGGKFSYYFVFIIIAPQGHFKVTVHLNFADAHYG